MRGLLAWVLGWPREADMTGGYGLPARPPAEVRAARQASRVLVARIMAVAVTLSGSVGILTVLGGTLDLDDARVLVASLTFAIFSATAAAGAALRRERPGLGGAVGVATVVLSAVAWLVLVSALWSLGIGDARLAGEAALLALAGSHASIVVRAQRPSDSVAIRTLGAASILLATFEAVSGALLLAEVIEVTETDDWVRTGAAVLIGLLVTTALPPLLRMAARAKPAAQGAPTAGTASPSPPAPRPQSPPPAPPPPPAARPAATPRFGAAALVLLAVLLAYSLGQAARSERSAILQTISTGMEKSYASERQVETLPVSAPSAPAPPAAPAPGTTLTAPPDDALPPMPRHLRPGRARPLGNAFSPDPLFTCATGPSVAERGGPAGRVRLWRSFGRLCVSSRSKPVPTRPLINGEGRVLTLRFRRSGDRRTADFIVRLVVIGGHPLYTMSLGPETGLTRLPRGGRVGAARGHLSVLVEDGGIPGWATDPSRSTWSARLA
jgi:hypothetical protein